MVFLDLPIEVIERIACCDSERIHTFLPSLTRTNRFIHDIVTPILYSTYIYDGRYDAHGNRLEEYLKVIASKPHLAVHLKSIEMRDWLSVWVDWSKGDHQRTPLSTMLRALFQNATKLQTSLIEYPGPRRHYDADYELSFDVEGEIVQDPAEYDFLNLVFPNLTELIVRPPFERREVEGANRVQKPSLYGSLHLYFLPGVLQSPQLKALNIQAVYIEDHEILPKSGVPPRSSPLKHLTLRIGQFLKPSTLAKLLMVPQALTHFTYDPPTSADVFQMHEDSWNQATGSNISHLPSFQLLGEAVVAQQHSLQYLKLHRADMASRRYADLSPLGSLYDMQALKQLHIGVALLIGWKHCQHISVGNTPHQQALAPIDLATFLPSSLEKLEIELEPQHRARNGKGYLSELVVGLVNEKVRLRGLTDVTFGWTDRHYCDECNHAAGCQGDGVSIQEVKAVDELVEGKGLSVDLSSCLCWDEEMEGRYWSRERSDEAMWVEHKVFRAGPAIQRG